MKIAAVLVTFNRISCLKKALACYSAQTVPPEWVIVVDNHSTDGTGEFLKQWEKAPDPFQKTVINLPCNMGGAGGFHAGMERAIQSDCDWVWVADDDAYPEKDALKALNDFSDCHPELMPSVSAMCGTIMDYDRQTICTGHHCREKKLLTFPVMCEVSAEEYQKEYFELDYISYVGTVFRKDALLQAGTAREDFFIYSDDWEHSMRIRKVGKILCIPDSVVLHMGASSVINKKAVWGDYYSTRNILVALKAHKGNGAFALRAVCRMLTALSCLNIGKVKIISAGISDAAKGKMGIHPIYKPGWKSK